MKWDGLESKYNQHIGSIMVVALVAVSAFMLGADYQSKKDVTAPANEETVSEQPAQNAITELQTTLSGESSPATTSSATAPATTTSTKSNGLVNINTAGLAELDTLPGIGPAYAQAIIDYRNQNGLFVSIEDLDKVKGIGPKTLDKLRPLITL